MIDKASAIENIMRKLKKIPAGQGLDLRTYKRDRSVAIMRTGVDSFSVVENGFDNEQFEEDFKGLKKLLKKLLKREFPRSNKIRVYDISERDLSI
ncbi:hypothetical protein [Desulfovibrio sp. JC022]|uniref:hypothetical protein n=1 Tax=Desulfovibrio sp. JC022 TaxID=2593642 RepID=UPI0013D85AB3|nr:hypothetical protein [Desulfovibrio sp. JC022]NDV22923.1 hypothetical protein [Desulfovibrio sp. JC022]